MLSYAISINILSLKHSNLLCLFLSSLDPSKIFLPKSGPLILCNGKSFDESGKIPWKMVQFKVSWFSHHISQDTLMSFDCMLCNFHYSRILFLSFWLVCNLNQPCNWDQISNYERICCNNHSILLYHTDVRS